MSDKIPRSAEQNAAMAQVCLDLHDALGVRWGDDPYAKISATAEALRVAREETLIAQGAHAIAEKAFNNALAQSRQEAVALKKEISNMTERATALMDAAAVVLDKETFTVFGKEWSRRYRQATQESSPK